MTASHVGDVSASLELAHNAVERRKPARDEIGVVPGAEEALASVVHIRHVVVPADTLAGDGGVNDPRRVVDRAQRDLKEPRQEGRAVGVGERHGLLRREDVAAGLGLILDVAARRLGVEPLARVSLGHVAAFRELGRGQRSGAGHRAVETQAVSHHDQRRVQCRADLLDRPKDEGFELGGVQGYGLKGLCHAGDLLLV